MLISCNDSKWQTINGSGISDTPRSISQAIFFADSLTGLVGGYHLKYKKGEKKEMENLEFFPLLYITTNQGQSWRQVDFDPTLRGSVEKCMLIKDSIICLIDTAIYVSKDNGKLIEIISDRIESSDLKKRLTAENRYDFSKKEIELDGITYYPKEFYSNQYAELYICRGPKTLEDYFIFRDIEDSEWGLLQSDFGTNSARFLYEDKYIFQYDYPFGLLVLKLK